MAESSDDEKPTQKRQLTRALVVEPDDEIRIVLTRILRQAFTNVDTAADAPAATRCCAEYPPDVALIGGYQRGLSQLELCRILKASASLKVIALVGVDAIEFGPQRDSALHDEVDTIIGLPFSPSRLLDAATALLPHNHSS